ncbi:MAG: hypothetical protein UV75_C0008G0011 [Candidatus Giovannonibacteria bacterium GW2011_GWA1_43_15]|uniref:Uncharacterized protein n=1 Tax=Candidatus Giovannonibacteria bacterium GW2011_GWA2_44_26 TaxID=1618648 RepID=A0A0G1IVI1_9BACT|nr:MAG: hypothetical protein UV72_C0002G0009 [Candidatus Giovannonibacteria bacterium GW2011_GWB1_43_13]KKS99177.1 MAG: hypothetical protein UV75_C0008G0011 [Candidatus Giovannonibacteria bacterium GW2011_GWA1_43_15]KKT21136.1 MAG: hypothetical protein UW05_C0017G0011 [Candidatus Giovannonibacteria bacterium GW2011_GWC2_43_8]KKT62978.1 MAG: hypothetical protein UW55_C0007G0018 [Candidatus Giovannonibacteria bacterium GW2011_GWA2_44_26]
MANLDDDKLDKGVGDDAVKEGDVALEDGKEGVEDEEDLDSWELEEEDLNE